MKEFNSLGSFAKHLEKIIPQYNEREFKALNFLGKILEEESKSKIGHLQAAAGDFPKWEELAESTKVDKKRKGYVFNEEFNPLYRTGELRDSIHHVVNRSLHTLYVGSDSDIGLYQEMGTQNIPARSFLGLTFFKEKAQIQFILGLFLLYWITNQNTALKRLTHGSV